MLSGYIDESADARYFTLCCLVGDGSMWCWIELAWKLLLEKTNERLAAQGRPPITRYHATDCRNLRKGFEGWAKEEQIAFTQSILKILRQHPLHIYAQSINLEVLAEEIPESACNPRGFAYVFLLLHLMETACSTLDLYPNEQLVLVHERCDYDSALSSAFAFAKRDPGFKHRDRFDTIRPSSWSECVQLQLADFVAYENFREVQRKSSERARSAALDILLNLDSISGRGLCFERTAIGQLRIYLNSLDEVTKDDLYRAARLH